MSTPRDEAIAEFIGTVTSAANVLADELTRMSLDQAVATLRNAVSRPTAQFTFGDLPTEPRARKPRKVTTDEVCDFVRKHPGHRIEHINTRFGVGSGDLAALVRKALASGRLQAKGYGRARKYYPGKKK